MRLLTICFILLTGIAAAQPSKIGKPKPSVRVADSLFQISDWKGAIPVYEAALKNEPNNSLAWNRLAFSYHSIANYDKALANYLKAIENKPNPMLEITIQSRLARIYSIRSEKEKAFASLDRAIRLGYANLSELGSQKEFENIRSDERYAEIVKRANLNAYPCMGSDQARQFDFWIGEWEVYVSGTNNLAGWSKIDLASGGCMILENWTSAGAPFNGKSMNFIDPVSGKWKQVWIGSGASPNVTEFSNGEYRDGAMRFDFSTTNQQGAKQLVHFYFFNQGPEQVRQFHETSNDEGKTWTTTYDFTYKRKK